MKRDRGKQPAAGDLTADEAQRLVQELQIHKFELETQNEELCRVQETLRVAAQEWQTTFDALDDAVWLLDAGQKITRGNRATLRLLGRPPAEIVGRHCWELVHGTAEPIAGCPIRRARESKHRETMDLRIGERWCAIAVDPILDAAGSFAGAVHVVSDITERRALQASLAQADRLSTMGMLSAGVAHEINNPLMYVLYHNLSLSQDLPRVVAAYRRCQAELLARAGAEAVARIAGDGAGALDPAALDDLVHRAREAHAGAERIREICRGLGTFSRVEQTEVTAVDVRAALENAATLAGNEIKYRARLVKDLAPVPPVLATAGKLAQVFLNLLVNACHAIGEGRVADNEIRVRTWAEGDRVCAEVRDTGHGIAPEHRGRIFEPFYTTKGVGKGSGLGLSISQNIVTGFGGEITFETEVGRGTRFVVRLPAAPEGALDRTKPKDAPALAGPQVRGRILVIDDEAGIRGGIARVLARSHEVVTVGSGEEGRALLTRDRKFDVLLLDLMMPQMSGMELHAWLAGVDPALAARTVFMTGGAFTPHAREYLARVQNRRLEKPFDPEAFTRLVGELVAAARKTGC